MPRVFYNLEDIPEASNKREFKNRHLQECVVCENTKTLNAFVSIRGGNEILDTCGRCRKAAEDREIERETVKIVMDILGGH